MKLVNSFNETGKTEGYTDRILLRILDNLHLVFKNVNIRIEEPNKKPFYSIGLTLKEILVIFSFDILEFIFGSTNNFRVDSSFLET